MCSKQPFLNQTATSERKQQRTYLIFFASSERFRSCTQSHKLHPQRVCFIQTPVYFQTSHSDPTETPNPRTAASVFWAPDISGMPPPPPPPPPYCIAVQYTPAAAAEDANITCAGPAWAFCIRGDVRTNVFDADQTCAAHGLRTYICGLYYPIQ